jgi:glycerophosphoryl diester phosphodiesterase
VLAGRLRSNTQGLIPSGTLGVHTWTFRDDASGYGFKDPKAEMHACMRLGLNRFFTDFRATGVAARAVLP